MAKQGKHRKTQHQTSDLDAVRTAPPPSETQAQLKRRNDQLVALLGVIHECASSLDSRTILDTIVRRALELLDADEGTIYLLDPSGQELQAAVAVGEFAAETLAAPVKVGEGITGYVAQTKVGEIVNHAEHDPRAKHIPGTPEGEPESLLCAPLLFQGRLIGVITLRRLGEREFEPDDLDFLTGLANHAAVTLEIASLLKQARDRSADLAALHDINLDISSQLDTQKLFEKITRQAANLLRAEGSTIDLYDPEAKELELISASNLDCRFIGTRLKVGEGLAGKVAQTGQPMTVEDYATWEGRSPQYEGVTFGSALAVPMEWQGQIIGVLGVHEIEKRRAFTEEEISLARLFAAQAAVALQNARLYEDLKAAYERLQVAQEEMLKVERLRALGQMASGIVHDFNNTLTPMLGFLLMALRDPALPSQVRSDLEQVRQGVLDATRIVNRLRDFYRPRDETEPTQLIGINQLVRDVVQSTRPQWHDAPKEQGRPIALSLQLGSVRSVRGHSADLQQMLMNLITNAVEAMPNGGTLSIRTRTDSDWVVLELADSGVGMPPEVKARLFEPFFTTKGEGHAGLGLATCYGVVQRHGGFIRVESRQGEGTWVTVRLPIANESTPPGGNLQGTSDVITKASAAKR